MDILKSIYPLVLTLNPTSSHIMKRLIEQRRVLVLRVREMVDQFGGGMFPDCNDVKMWNARGPKKLFADISPDMERREIGKLDEFV